MGALVWGLRFAYYFTVARITHRLAKINLSITSVCNSRCRTCDIWKVPRRSRDTDLNIDDYSRLFRNSPKSICWISITGGEPFLRDDLEAIVNEAVRNFPRVMLLSITTNALDDRAPVRVLQNLLAHHPQLRIYLNISLDGDTETHDYLRGMPGNWFSCFALREKLRNLESRYTERLKVTFETTVSRANQSQVRAIGELARIRKTFHIFTVARVSQFYKHRLVRKTSDFLEASEIVGFTRNYLAEMRFKLGFDHLIRRALYRGTLLYYGSNGKHPVGCTAGKTSVWIGAKGEVSPCINWAVELGNSKQESLKTILASPAAKGTRRAIRKQQCPGCWTPCEATQSLLASPLSCLVFAITTFPNLRAWKKPWLRLRTQPGLQS